MLYTIVKNHRVESGETASAVKYEGIDEALRNYHMLASNYMADTNVIAWSMGLLVTNAGEDMRIIKLDSYSRV